jgi:hypothetical protein
MGMDLSFLLHDLFHGADASMRLISGCCNATDTAYCAYGRAGEGKASKDFEGYGGGDGEGRGHGMEKEMPWEVNWQAMSTLSERKGFVKDS